mmetsp:Transcript_8337/g.17929  ORF Transcript_8337/g.17929 Transcript_8337/m.17929 type:complete len:340 (+) Transcript_8337:3-1022(+)
MMDLVSFDVKHNEANGENNRDGESHNSSWNCGAEGITHDIAVLSLRHRQVRNFFVALFLSAGTPMMLMADETGHTKHGNNNAWCQDTEANYFQWNLLRADRSGAGGSREPSSEDHPSRDVNVGCALHRFVRSMIRFRRKHRMFRPDAFVGEKDITWHGRRPGLPQWESAYNLLAFTMKDHERGEDVYVAFNAGGEEQDLELPAVVGKTWFRIVDTNRSPPNDFVDFKTVALQHHYRIAPWSALVLKALPAEAEILVGPGLMRSYSATAQLARTSTMRGFVPEDQNSADSTLPQPGPSQQGQRPSVLRETESRVNLAVRQEMPRSISRSFSRWDLSQGHS